MVVYAVEEIRKKDGKIIPYTSVEAILYATREGAEAFIAYLKADEDWKKKNPEDEYALVVSPIDVSGSAGMEKYISKKD